MNLKELAEKAYAVLETYPVKIPPDQKDDWYFLKFQEELGELTQAYLRVTQRARSKGESPEVLRKKLAEELLSNA